MEYIPYVHDTVAPCLVRWSNSVVPFGCDSVMPFGCDSVIPFGCDTVVPLGCDRSAVVRASGPPGCEEKTFRNAL